MTSAESEKTANDLANQAIGEKLAVSVCPNCQSKMIVGCGSYWKCLNCGSNSAGKRLRDPLNFTKGAVEDEKAIAPIDAVRREIGMDRPGYDKDDY